jgi:hypothetical protein
VEAENGGFSENASVIRGAKYNNIPTPPTTQQQEGINLIHRRTGIHDPHSLQSQHSAAKPQGILLPVSSPTTPFSIKAGVHSLHKVSPTKLHGIALNSIAESHRQPSPIVP